MLSEVVTLASLRFYPCSDRQTNFLNKLSVLTNSLENQMADWVAHLTD